MPHPVAAHASNWLWRFIGRMAFNQISVIGREKIPASGPIIFVATHRNGALDAAPYRVAAPSAVPMVSAQLHRFPFGRVLFHGIAVAREKDRARGIAVDNEQSLHDCVALLKAGGQLFVMPEGTSTLGPRHLPYHRGAARIVRAAMDAGVIPRLVPMAVHYEAPTVWQSRVEVLVGPAIQPDADAKVADLHRHITQGLDAVGANFPDEDTQRRAELLAYAATLGTNVSYAMALKSCEEGFPDGMEAAVQQLQQIARQEKMALHQGVPLLPVGPWLPYVAYWVLLAPVSLFFFLINLPALAAGYLASRRLPDAPNVIAFWRMVAGLPVGVVWVMLMSLLMWLLDGAVGVAVYWAITVGGILAWYRFRKLSIALWNAVFHANTRPALMRAYQNLLDRMSHDHVA